MKESKSENEKLLYQVLCMLLPFNVIVNLSDKQRNIDFDKELTINMLNKFTFYRINYNMRPRLRLWDDMVREEIKYEDEQFMFDAPLMVYNKAPDYIMWLLSLHVDAFNLIPKGLALKKLEK